MAKGIQVGDEAPLFTLPNAKGESVSLQDVLKKGPAVVYFYPKDETAGCTAQACAFRDAYEDFKALGAEVIGISSDSASSHDSFAAHHRLPFVLLSDKTGEARRLFGVPTTLGILPGRVTYVIDTQGVVRHVFNSQLQTTRHVKEAMKILGDICAQKQAS